MRGLALGLLLLLPLSSQAALSPTPDIPGLFDLGIASPPALGGVMPWKASEKTLTARILSPTPSHARYNALEAAAARVEFTVWKTKRKEYWKSVDHCLDRLDFLFDNPVEPAYRRYAIYVLFHAVFAPLATAILEAPDDPRWPKRWERLDVLRLQGMRDNDVGLQNYFQRHLPVADRPSWRSARERAEAAQKKLLADLSDPKLKSDLEEIWQIIDRESARQQRFRENVGPAGKRGLTGTRAAAMDLAADNLYEHRLYSLWASWYPSLVTMLLGPDAARGAGLTREPVSLGWPEFAPPKP